MQNQLRGKSPTVITFIVTGDCEYADDRPDTFVQLSEQNAYDLLQWLSYDASDFGYMDPAELRARCIRRLWPMPRNYDPAIPERREAGHNVTLVVAGREAGYLRTKTEEMLKLADRALQLSQVEGMALGILFS